MVPSKTAPAETPPPADARPISSDMTDRERSLLRDAERIRDLREQYWDALANGPVYEANRLQDELRLAQHRFRERSARM